MPRLQALSLTALDHRQAAGYRRERRLATLVINADFSLSPSPYPKVSV